MRMKHGIERQEGGRRLDIRRKTLRALNKAKESAGADSLKAALAERSAMNDRAAIASILLLGFSDSWSNESSSGEIRHTIRLAPGVEMRRLSSFLEAELRESPVTLGDLLFGENARMRLLIKAEKAGLIGMEHTTIRMSHH